MQDSQGDPLVGEYGGLTFDDQGTATTTLTSGQSLTLRGLPDGTVCTVYEEPVQDYETTVQVNGGTAQPGPQVTVTTQAGLTSILYENRSTRTPPPATATPEPSTTATSPAATATPRPSQVHRPLGVPPTGDNFSPGLWAVLAGLAAASLTGLLVLRRKHHL